MARKLDPNHINAGCRLPYGLTVGHVAAAAAQVYEIVDAMNRVLTDHGHGVMEHILLGNSFSGIVSELTVRALGLTCDKLVRNEKVGGHPDLVPPGKYPDNSVLKGDQGIEIKTSKQSGGWQGHNPEDGWFMVLRYEIPEPEDEPFRYVEILAAELVKDDWSFSGRKGTSRRTPTASILKSGVAKLRRNHVYRLPGYEVGKRTRSR